MSGHQQQWNGQHLGDGAALALGQILALNNEQTHLLRSLHYHAEQSSTTLGLILQRIDTRGSATMASTPPHPSLPEITEFIKEVRPLIILFGAAVMKGLWPDLLPVLRSVLKTLYETGALG